MGQGVDPDKSDGRQEFVNHTAAVLVKGWYLDRRLSVPDLSINIVMEALGSEWRTTNLTEEEKWRRSVAERQGR